jgi:KR domain-containing protein
LSEAEFDGVFDPEDPISKELAHLIARDTPGSHAGPAESLVSLFARATEAISQTRHVKICNGKIVSHELRSESVESILRAIHGYRCVSTHVFSLSPDTIVNVKTSREISPLHDAVSPDGIYVLIGAFGGLGEVIARMLVSGGARNLVFLSRLAESRPRAKAFADGLRSEGVSIRSFEVDIGDLHTLRSVWFEIADSGSVVGVVQCAAVLKVCCGSWKPKVLRTF